MCHTVMILENGTVPQDIFLPHFITVKPHFALIFSEWCFLNVACAIAEEQTVRGYAEAKRAITPLSYQVRLAQHP